MAAGCKLPLGLVLAGILTGTLLGGCSETLPLANLPGMARLPETVLSKDEQQKAMNQMIEKGQTHQAEVAKQIEKSAK